MFIALLFVVGAWGQPPLKPDALLRAEAARMRFRTALIEYESFLGENDADPTVISTRFDASAQLLVNKGRRSDGSQVADPDLAMGQPFSFGERRFLMGESHGNWEYFEGSVGAGVSSKKPEGMFDIRSMGLNPYPIPDLPPEEAFSGENVVDYKVIESPEKTTVIAKNKWGSEIIWELEPAFDDQPVHVRVERNGRILSETRLEYDAFDGLWFPSHYEYFDWEGRGGKLIDMKMTRVEFDRPEHPKTLTPADIGVMVGMQVGTDQGVQYWDGESFLSPRENYERRQQGLLDASEYTKFFQKMKSEGPPGRYPKNMEGVYFGLVSVQRNAELWEEYVRRFIKVFELNDEQQSRAWEVHKKWQPRASARLEETAETIEKIDKDLLRIREETDLIDGATREMVNLKERRAKLLAPVEDIFMEEFRPGLFEIPTPEQKKAVIAREREKPGSSELITLLGKTPEINAALADTP